VEKTEKMSHFEAETLPHLQSLWQTAIYLTGNEQDAENLVEDTYIEAFKIWDEFSILSELLALCRFFPEISIHRNRRLTEPHWHSR